MTVPILEIDYFVRAHELGDYQDSFSSLAAPPRDKFIFNVEGDKNPSEEVISILWFSEETKASQSVLDGFYPWCEDFEFSVLWYSILDNYLDHYELGNWDAGHGGLHFAYYGKAKEPENLRSNIEEIWPLAFAKYTTVIEKLIERGSIIPL